MRGLYCGFVATCTGAGTAWAIIADKPAHTAMYGALSMVMVICCYSYD